MGATGHFHHDFCDYMSRGVLAKFDIQMEKLVQHTRGCLDASKYFYIAISPVTLRVKNCLSRICEGWSSHVYILTSKFPIILYKWICKLIPVYELDIL